MLNPRRNPTSRFSTRRKFLTGLFTAAAMAAAIIASPSAQAAEKKDFKVCWSIYVGWMPWGYMKDAGIVKKWADKYDISIDVVQINDYVESINQYTAGQFDGCSMTNMDALTIPAAGGVDTTALIVGDFSNGNDGLVMKKGDGVKAMKGQRVNLVELSVSHYLLARALDSAGMTERDITTVNTSDADIVSAFTSSADVTNVVTWNPQLAEVAKVPGATKVFDSSMIPGEIIDIMMVNTKTLKDNPKFGMALVGAWYETMSVMSSEGKDGIAARTAMARAAGTDLKGYEMQLATTKMFFEPKDAVAFTNSPDLIKTMDYVAEFSFAHQLLGPTAKSKDAVGMEFPGGKTLGDTANIKLRFDPTYMAMAAEGKL